MAGIVDTAQKLGFSPGKLGTADCAAALDKADPFRRFRGEFFIPPLKDHSEGIYLCGNSLGLLSRRAKEHVDEELQKWKLLGVEGHFEGKRPWMPIDEMVTPKLKDVVGAKTSAEVCVMNTLSSNLHSLLLSFYRPTKQRFKILMEESAFTSDHHVIRSQVAFRGLQFDDAVVMLRPSDGRHLTVDEIVKAIDEHKDELALVFFGGVQYYTGQFFDLKTITAAGHAAGATVAFDLAHAVGNVELKLHEWGVDFAAWCSYKYLNAGPGAIGGLFVHERHHGKVRPALTGWWGQNPKTRFEMGKEWKGLAGAQAWQLSNPAVLPTVCLLASLEIFESAGGVTNLRTKSKLLTGYLEQLVQRELPKGSVRVITPTDPERRGCQLSLLFRDKVKPIERAVAARGVTVDIREPNVMRVAPVPLYNSFSDVQQFVQMLKDALQSGAKAAAEQKSS